MSSIFVFIFKCIPNFYSLKILKSLFLKFSGVKVKLASSYVLAPFYIDNPKALSIGRGVFINKCVLIEGDGLITIGNNCQIGPRVTITTTNHDIHNNMECVVKDVIIKDNVWIGAGAIILPGVSIGPNVVVASGAIVSKNYDNCLVMGTASKKR